MSEEIPESVAADGAFTLWFVPAGEDPLSAAVLTGATAKRLTYSLTDSGFNRTSTEEVVADPRLTLRRTLQRAGRVNDEITLQYVYGSDADVANAALVRGTKGNLVCRYAVPNEEAPTAAQIVDVIPIECGRQAKDAPTANGVWTKTQRVYVTGELQEDVPLVV